MRFLLWMGYRAYLPLRRATLYTGLFPRPFLPPPVPPRCRRDRRRSPLSALYSSLFVTSIFLFCVYGLPVSARIFYHFLCCASSGRGKFFAAGRRASAAGVTGGRCAPGGGLNPGGTGSTCRWGARRGACLPCRLPTLPFAFFLPPIPPTPFPGGEGGIKNLFRRGLRPRHPCIKPPAALTASAMRTPRAREPVVRRNTDRSPFL